MSRDSLYQKSGRPRIGTDRRWLLKVVPGMHTANFSCLVDSRDFKSNAACIPHAQSLSSVSCGHSRRVSLSTHYDVVLNTAINMIL